jgi:hypothetical protein
LTILTAEAVGLSPSISRLPENASAFPFETGSGGAKRAKSKKEKKK